MLTFCIPKKSDPNLTITPDSSDHPMVESTINISVELSSTIMFDSSLLTTEMSLASTATDESICIPIP